MQISASCEALTTRRTTRRGSTLVQGDHDIATGIEAGGGARRHDAGRVVFLDDERAAPLAGQIRPTHDRRLEPAGVAEIGAPRRRRLRLGATGLQALGDRRALAQALADDLDRHQLDRLVLARAMAIGLLVLLAERLLEMLDHRRIDRSLRHGYGELVALALVV